MTSEHQSSLSISKIIDSIEKIEGKGAKVRRTIGTHSCPSLDPFLMMDHFFVKLPHGFPDHPHRGFETVTYMISGTILHEDFKGHKGKIGPGDIQWMTAGKGIVHAEIPGSESEESIGIQLWINLDNKNRMIDPIYQEYKNEEIPIVSTGKSRVKIISGEYDNHIGPIKSITSVQYYDINLYENDEIKISLDSNKELNIFIYNYGKESFYIQNKEVSSFKAVTLFKNKKEDKEKLVFYSKSYKNDEFSRFVIVIAHPLNQPVYQYGPFVMSNKQEVLQTIEEYQNEENGFEGAGSWNSEIKDMMKNGKSNMKKVKEEI